MKNIITIVLSAALLLAFAGCKPKANENITFTATITSIEADGILMETADEVGFSEVLLHIAEGYTPDFAPAIGQIVKATILPMVTRSLPPQATAVKMELLTQAPDNGVASVTEGLDPMPMLTAGPVTGSPQPEADTPENHIANLHPILDSILRTMGIEREQAYMPSDPFFRWSVLQYMCEHWAHTSADVQQSEGGVTVPESALAGWAAAAFGGSGKMPAVPEEMAQWIRYDAETKTYTFQMDGSDLTTVTAIDGSEVRADGVCVATVGLYGENGTRLGGMTFTLTPNTAAEGTYRYFVTAAEADTNSDN